LKQRLRIFVAPDAPVKIIQLRLENTWSHPRRITATYYAAWVLGINREASQQFIIPDFDADSQSLLAYNPYNVEFGERVAFAAANKKLHGLTADRTEFLGRMGSSTHPAGLGRIGLASMIEAGIDPCAALMLHIDLPPGEAEEVYFLLGEGADRTEALNLVRSYQVEEQVVAAWQAVGKFWDNLLDTICIQTPDPAMDLMLNRWLLYQDLACRIWARTAFYQSSGAYGFRDQLQDVMAAVHTLPTLAREQILRAPRRRGAADRPQRLQGLRGSRPQSLG
jgi:cyclic beta-1,2-glucan synthetase